MKRTQLLFSFGLFGLILFCLSFTNATYPANYSKNEKYDFVRDTTRKPVRIEKTNWTNSMDCTFGDTVCVALAEDNILYAKLIARFGDQSVLDYPPMHFFYTFYGPGNFSMMGVTGAITPPMVEPTVLEYGDEVWKGVFHFELDMNTTCEYISTQNFPVYVEYMLVTPVPVNDDDIDVQYTPYPVGDYPGLFPPDTFYVDPVSGLAEYHELRKEVCCAGESQDCSESPEMTFITNESGSVLYDNRNGQSSLGTIEENEDAINGKLFPNPFSSNITLNLTSLDPHEEVTLLVYNREGKEIAYHSFTGDQKKEISTENWVPGLYFFKVFSSGQMLVLKSIKH